MATSDLPSDPRDYDRWFRDRKPDPRAEAEQFERWMEDLGLSENQLHKVTGRPRGYIQQRRALLHSCPEIIAAWDARQVSWTNVREILAGARDNLDAQRATLDMVIKRRKARRRVDASAIRMFARGAASAGSSAQE